MNTEPVVVYEPCAGTSQEWAIDSRADDTLVCGTRGGGKTAVQLMRFRRYVGIGYGAFWRGVIFDKKFKDLADIVAQAKKFFLAFNDGAIWYNSPTEYKWVWPTGEVLLFRHAEDVDDYDTYHGHEYPFLGYNELTKWATPEFFDKMQSTNRSSFVPELHTPKDKNGKYLTGDGKPLPDIPLQRFSTTNPNGPGHNWVKKRYISVAPYGVPVRTQTQIFNPRTQREEIVTNTQVTIFSSFRENKFLSPKYIAQLNDACKNNPNLAKAWLKGSWDITAGGAIDDLWDSSVHVIENFKIPHHWYVDKSFDWGSTHPFSYGVWAEANGEEVELADGSKWCPPAGTLIQVAEWYGSEEIGFNKGLRLGSKDVARGIKEREAIWLERGIIPYKPFAGPADNQIDNVTDASGDTVGASMRDEGIIWTESDKSPGSRVNGLQLFRDRLKASVEHDGSPEIYFMRRCKASIETLPILQLDDKKIDDVDTKTEDHAWDMTRYRILKGSNRIAKHINIKWSV